ncbi:TRAP-type C4-dicarboxylate transport system, small permease component [Burkholderiales bacterium JOSHI_001]|nr:TRAP-type C4-dicarboxylate transport system, small permease component [Burkholderiales bacterium JOSHI_001]
MNQVLQAVDAAIGWACRAVLYVTLSVVFAILAANVALRYAAGTSIAWASELPELMFPWMIMAGVVLAAQHGSHIAVVLLTQKLGAARRWVLGGGSLIVAALYGGLAWMALPVAEIAHDEKTPILQVPGSVSVGCLVLGFALLAVVTLCHLPRLWQSERVDAQEAADALAHGA